MIALFAGSFHPPTNGHLDIIRRASCMFERVIVAVMVNPEKKYLLSAEERCEMLRRAAAGLDNVEAVWGTGLTAELARKLGAGVLVRGVRNVTDMEYELQAADVNRMLTGIDTVFLPSKPEHRAISSTIVMDVARHGGSFDGMVPEPIRNDIRRWFSAG